MGIFNAFKRQDLPTEPQSNSSNPDIRYLELVLGEWLRSPVREEQLLAEKYYDGHHDILERQKKVIGADGRLIAIDIIADCVTFRQCCDAGYLL